jgi:demethylmenaquinone methyltransferase/2-methoxy-6-polyprenyl-1,4-benzoquinol methylase
MPSEISNDNNATIAKSKELTRATYNRLSHIYDALGGSSERKFIEKGLALLDTKEGEKVLEIGFGTGHSLVTLSEAAGNNGKVFGVDISDEMFKISKRRLARKGLSDRVQLVRHDAAHLPYSRNFFDAIFMSFVLELFDSREIDIVIDGCNKALKLEGRICIVGLSKEKTTIVSRTYEFLHEKFPNYIDCRPIYITKTLTGAGFRIAKFHLDFMWGLPVETVLAIKDK